VCETTSPRRLYHEHTSGTSGKPIDLFRSVETVQNLYALSELRERRWHGVSVQQRWAILGGQLVAPVTRRVPPFWVWNAALNQLYMSSYHLAPDLVPHYLDALERFRIQYLWGYSSALHTLAQEALRVRRPLKMKVVITNAEPLFSEQRKTISEAFQCPVRETYGMAEFVVAASECEAGSLHLWPEVGVVEVMPDSGSAPDDRTGELVCTSLLNTAMPLIRYRTGDRGRLAHSTRTCDCGRTLPIIESVEGRVDDTIYTTDGRRVGRIDPVFKTRLDLREAQIIQETLQRVRVRFVAGPGFEESTGQTIVQRLRDRLGPVEVVLEPVADIPRGAHGKFRGVVCALSPLERQKVGLA
jgi:phenylacetate-CoA ligase